MSQYFLWGAVVLFIAFPSAGGLLGLSLAGLVGVIGWVLLVLGR